MPVGQAQAACSEPFASVWVSGGGGMPPPTVPCEVLAAADMIVDLAGRLRP